MNIFISDDIIFSNQHEFSFCHRKPIVILTVIFAGDCVLEICHLGKNLQSKQSTVKSHEPKASRKTKKGSS